MVRVLLTRLQLPMFSQRKEEELLVKLRKILAASGVGDDALNNPEVFTRLASSSSIEVLFRVLEEEMGQVTKHILHGLLSDEEWKELSDSKAAFTSGSLAQLRMVRLRRQQKLFRGVRRAVVDLTVQDDGNVEEQTLLVSDCMQMMQDIMTCAGMSPRGTLRRVVAQKKVTPPPVEEVVFQLNFIFSLFFALFFRMNLCQISDSSRFLFPFLSLHFVF